MSGEETQARIFDILRRSAQEIRPTGQRTDILLHDETFIFCVCETILSQTSLHLLAGFADSPADTSPVVDLHIMKPLVSSAAPDILHVQEIKKISLPSDSNQYQHALF